MRRMRSLCAKVLKDLEVHKQSPDSLKHSLEPIFQYTSEVSLQELGLKTPIEPLGEDVGFIPVIKGKNYSIGIFIIPPGARIPLHDHPGMCVISRVLYGKMNVISFDWKHGEQKYGNSLGGNAQVTANKVVEAPETALLLPGSSNLHEFRASNENGAKGVAILDIICPNYSDSEDRPCTYYQVERLHVRPDSYEKCMVKPNEIFSNLSVGDVVHLLPITQPSDFSVFTHPYKPFDFPLDPELD
mmetsp:Transcript_7637/g.8768  ORF Transcript_7637/g.8768 Transcript_7637/m.8768 type:complete len:243 (+) Transcript_7637:354-1082(+)